MATLGESTITTLTLNKLETSSNDISKNDILGINMRTVLLDSIYPVGSVYIYSGNTPVSTCPIASTLGGTWVQIKEKFLLAAGDTHTLGATGGNAKGYLLDHIHDATGQQTATGNTDSAGSHKHGLSIDKTSASGAFSDSGWRHRLETTTLWWPGSRTYTNDGRDITDSSDVYMDHAGSHSHTVNVSATTIKTKTDSILVTDSLGNLISSSSAQKDKDEANMPPYITVLVWQRTK